jgi:hypothetical protein
MWIYMIFLHSQMAKKIKNKEGEKRGTSQIDWYDRHSEPHSEHHAAGHYER